MSKDRDEIKVDRFRYLALENLERAAISWHQSELDYNHAYGEALPFSEEYSRIIENRIFNKNALLQAAARQALNNGGSDSE